MDLNLAQTPNILFLSSNTGMRLRLSKPINFMGKSLRCKAVITSTSSYFCSNDLWYQVGNETITSLHDDAISDVFMVSYEADSEDFYTTENCIIYKGDEHQRISKLGDRHKKTEERQQDRHKLTEERSKNNRNKLTEKRKQDRHKDSWSKLKKDINDDTGMDVCCCSCLEMKSRRSCVSASTLSPKLVKKYCYQKEICRNLDGKFYVCLTCQLSIKADKEPTRALKELIGFLDFPKGNIELLLKNLCAFKNLSYRIQEEVGGDDC